MMCDVRESTSEEMLKVFNSFKKIKPEIRLFEERPTLIFEKSNKKLVVSNIYFHHDSIYCEFYTGVDNIRFDGKIVLTEDLKSKITELIKHGTSKNVLDYI